MRNSLNIFLLAILFTLSPLTQAQTDITPSRVFQATQQLVSEIEILRNAFTVRGYPPNPEQQEDRSPIHAYAKSLEVLQKLIWIEQKYNIAPSPLGQIPIKAVTPEDVLDSVSNLLDEVARIKKQLGIKASAKTPALPQGKTPSDVYNNINLASLLLDGIVGRSLSLNDVFRTTQYAIDEMQLIAEQLKVKLDLQPPGPGFKHRKLPKDIAQQVYLAVNRIIDLQESLKMNASIVPNLTMVRITPTEIYDATSALLAELVRIKHYLDIRIPLKERSLPFAKRADDVFANMRLINKNLDLLNSSVAQSWR
jgi:hypothetical protein